MKQPLNFTAELVPVAYAEALLDLVAEYGVSRQALFDAARVRPEVLDSPTAACPSSTSTSSPTAPRPCAASRRWGWCSASA